MNVIVLVADSLRVDHLGCYGSAVQTPNLDRLAGESATFDQAYAENLPTLPCRTAWWTGRHLFTQRGWQPFAPSDYLLAEVLWDKGYSSALITDVYHMHKPVYNCGRGFATACAGTTRTRCGRSGSRSTFATSPGIRTRRTIAWPASCGRRSTGWSK
jgi:arylsulfatase A-like enzyme